MDIYNKFIAKIYEETGGNDSQAVDFVDLVKREGFYGSYNDLFKELNNRGWITETSKPDWIKITHWGIREAKRAQSGEDSAGTLQRDANLLLAESQEFAALVEEFLKDASNDNFVTLEKKLAGLNKAFSFLKANF
jgi:hypothetical protein